MGRRFTGGMLVPEDVVSFESGDLAYTVGFERGEVSVHANAPTTMTIRVTHIRDLDTSKMSFVQIICEGFSAARNKFRDSR